MLKKIALAAVGLTLLASPLIVSAQLITLPTVPSNASVQDLQSLIQQLTQILNQLLALRYPSPSSVTFDALPKAGLSPLTVTFTSSSSGGMIDFGDGQTAPMSLSQCAQTATIGSSLHCSLSHVYASLGTYKAKLYVQTCSSSSMYGSACPQAIAGAITITVLDSTPSACSMYVVPVCPTGTHLIGSQVYNGCKSGGQCVSDSAGVPIVCPVYQQPLCPSGQHNVNSGTTYDANGCSVPHNACVADNSLTTCPNYTFALCPTGQHNVVTTSSYDANNCPIKTNACVADSSSASCTAPRDGHVYASGQVATYEDWCAPTSASAYCGSGTKICQNGIWVSY